MKWLPMATAPRDGRPILGYYDDGAVEIRWAEERVCMLAGVGGGNGYFGAGWEDVENGLIVDDPVAWRWITPAAPSARPGNPGDGREG